MRGRNCVVLLHAHCYSCRFFSQLQSAEWFGFVEVDIEIPKLLRPKFKEMCPLFYNKVVPEEAVPVVMKDYLVKTGCSLVNGRKLLGALSAKKALLFGLLLKRYVVHGAVVKAMCRSTDYQPRKIFTWFVEQVMEAQRTGNVGKSKVLEGSKC